MFAARKAVLRVIIPARSAETLKLMLLKRGVTKQLPQLLMNYYKN